MKNITNMMLKMQESRLFKAAWMIVGITFLVQCMLVFIYWDYPDGPDSIGYIKHALDNYAIGSTYPSRLNLKDQYLQAPGMVNYLILQHAVFGTTDFRIDKVFNVFFSLGVVVNVWYLAKRFFNQATACVAVIIYSLLPTNVFAPIHLLTELPYLFLTLTGFSLSLQKKWYFIAGAGALYAVAHTFRPLVLAFLMVSVVLYLIERRRLLSYLLLVLPYIFILWGIGQHNKSNTGYFVTSSTTGGYNLIMSANDRAMARPEFSIFTDSTNIAFIPDRAERSFAERDSIYKARAMQWIRQNPGRYFMLYVEKIGRLWSGDTWSMPKFSKWDDWDYIRTLPDPGHLPLIRRCIQAVEGLPYYVMMLFFFATLVWNRREIFSRKGLFLLIILLGTAGTCLFTVEVRFHYPYLFAVVLWTAYGIYTRRMRKKASPEAS